MDAIKYLKEKKRMLDSLGRKSGRCVGIYCEDCPFSENNNAKGKSCGGFELEYPEEAIAIVEKWAEEHPQKTLLMDFLEKYPNAILDEKDGTPLNLCPEYLGYERKIECKNCIDCWNRPLEG